jgi:hypothetical protein
MLSDGIDFPSVALGFDPTTFVSRGRAFAHCRKGPTCSFVPLMLGLGHYGTRKSPPSAEGSALGLKSRILISNILPEGGVGGRFDELVLPPGGLQASRERMLQLVILRGKPTEYSLKRYRPRAVRCANIIIFGGTKSLCICYSIRVHILCADWRPK